MGVESLEGQSGILRVMVLLLELGAVHQDRLNGPRDLYPRVIESSLEKLEKAGLVKRWVDDDAWTLKKMSELTDKGIEVARKVKEIDLLLSDK